MNIRLSIAFFSHLILGAVMLFGPGSARAQDYDAGMAAFEAGDYERAVKIWDPLALSGDSTAQYSLGKLFETGNIDLERDYGRAVEWYRLAAAQGVAAAQNNLGLMYTQGRGVARDTGRAVELWSQAAKQNHSMAQFNLGLAYFRGEGVAENKQEAESWFRRAAELGLADSQYALGQVRFHGLTAEADPGEALAWYQLAAAQGHVKARVQAEILRKDGVKPRMDMALDAPGTPRPAAPAKTRTAQAPAPTAPKAQKAVKPPAPAEPKVQKAAKQTAATVQPAAKQNAVRALIDPPKPAPAKATPLPQIKSQVARAAVGAAPLRSGGNVKAWLFSAKSEGEAIRYLRRIEGEQGPILAGVDSAVIPVQLDGSEVFYRVVAGDFETWNDGRAWCGLLNARIPGTFCKVLPVPGAAQ